MSSAIDLYPPRQRIGSGGGAAQAWRAKSTADAWKRDTGKYEARGEQWAAVYRDSQASDAYARARFMAGREVLAAYLHRQ
jgi:hypothetical protein